MIFSFPFSLSLSLSLSLSTFHPPFDNRTEQSNKKQKQTDVHEAAGAQASEISAVKASFFNFEKREKRERKRERESLSSLPLLRSRLVFSILSLSPHLFLLKNRKQAILGKYSVSDADIQKLLEWKHAH